MGCRKTPRVDEMGMYRAGMQDKVGLHTQQSICRSELQRVKKPSAVRCESDEGCGTGWNDVSERIGSEVV